MLTGCLAGALLVPQSAVLAQPKPDRVTVISPHPKKPRRDGGKIFKYHLVDKGKKFRFRASGPADLILWTRGFRRGLVRLKLEYNSEARGDVRLDAMPKVSRGI